MKLELRIVMSRLTLDDLVAIEEGDQSARFVRSILGRFSINPETGDFYPDEDGTKISGKLNVEEAQEAVKEFATKVQELRAAKIPLVNADN